MLKPFEPVQRPWWYYGEDRGYNDIVPFSGGSTVWDILKWAEGAKNIPRVLDESATKSGAISFSPVYEESWDAAGNRIDPASIQFDPRQRVTTNAEYYRRQAAAQAPLANPYSVISGYEINHPAIATQSPDVQEARPATPDQQRPGEGQSRYGEPQRAINDYNERRRLEYEERLRRAREIIARGQAGTLNRGFDWAETEFMPYSAIQTAAGGGYLR